jgi:GNAT superfamily N-acetyltransferase
MSDVDGIVKLLKLVFHVDFSREWWCWKYKANPAGFWGEKGDIWVAESEDEIVGYWAVLPVEMKFGSRTITVAQAVDAATHPNYRKQGINTTLVKNVFSDIRNRYDFVFGFPAEILYKYRIKQGWKLLPLSEFLIFLNYDRPLRNYFNNGFLARLGKTALRAYIAGRKFLSNPSVNNNPLDFVEIQEVNGFPGEVDDFWRQVRSEYEMCVERTATFLNWRFSKNLGEYQVFIARSIKTKNVTGYLVLKKAKIQHVKIKNVLDVVDLQTLPGHDKCLLDLIDVAMKVAKDNELDVVHFRVPTWHRHAKILSKKGAICINRVLKLLRVYEPHANFFEFKNMGLISKIQSWFYTLADTDYA